MRNKSGMEWFFERVFPKLFIAIFVIVFTVIIVQFAVIGWAGYNLLTDPEGTANTVGTVVGEVIRPVVDAIKGE